ncbi:TM2 domain-containing protein 3-like [Asterias rubens]|uniref:TM2 domain-containing protein 3-like n=1 Tax=Asterias rubens TaxID=7604 RepID=UPI00145537D5|nr:TM2 domain-containing protein 3-like [Asterias rubens]
MKMVRFWSFVLLGLFISFASNVCGKGETTVEYDINSTPFAQQQTSHVTMASEKSTNNSDLSTSDTLNKGTLTSQQPLLPTLPTTVYPNHRELCPSRVDCFKLSGDCLDCELNSSCVYGREYNVTCRPKPDLDCVGNQTIIKSFRCRYCYQSEPWEQTCTPTIKHSDCKVNSNPPIMVRVNCSINDDLICLGQRKFYRRSRCNWTSGHRWSTALTLSVTLGGFGADRFYLGSWRAGLGKLFSFGGLGVWTLVDVVLIAVGYIRPEDGSYYI